MTLENSDDVASLPMTVAAEQASVANLIRQVGSRVGAARKNRRMSRRELSERSGVSPRYLAKLESGDGNISIGLLQKVATALQTPIECFVMPQNMHSVDIPDIVALFQRADAETRAQVLRVLEPAETRVQKAERVCLVGLRGAGKSTLGTRVGHELGAPFVELNREIEMSAGMPVGEIIALYGQEGYRQLEADTLRDIIKAHTRIVLAVAGGIVSDEKTFAQVLSGFHTVWIKASAGEHMDRVRAQGDMRPMQGNPQAMAQLRQILKSREALYARADQVLDTSGIPVERSGDDLLDLIQKCQMLTPR